MPNNPLLVLPGITGGFSALRGFRAALAEAGLTETEVVGVDLAEITGGASAADLSGPAAVDELVASVASHAAAASPGQPADVLAESTGATIALRLAVTRPELVRSLVLVAPVGYAQPISAPGGAHRAADAITALYAGDDVAVASALAGLGSADFEPTAAQVAEYAGYRTGAAAGLASMVSGWWSGGAFDSAGVPGRHRELREVWQPVQLVWGRDDAWTGLDAAFFLLRRLRTVQLRVVPRCGHLVSLEAPAALGRALRTFLSVPRDAPPGRVTAG